MTCAGCVHWAQGKGRGAEAMWRAGMGVCGARTGVEAPFLYRSGTRQHDCKTHSPCEHALQSERVEFIARMDAQVQRRFDATPF